MKISKERFISYIHRLMDYRTREDMLSSSLRNYCEDFSFFAPKDVLTLITDMLIDLSGDNREDSIIEYWMYELNYGSGWLPGTITYNGRDIKLQTVEDLYNYLVTFKGDVDE